MPVVGSRIPEPKPWKRLWIERDRVTVGVGRHERDRVAVGLRRCDAGGEVATHLVAERSQMPVVEQGRHVGRHPVGVGQVTADVTKADEEHTRDRPGVGAERVGIEAESLDHREDLQQRVPL